ncbi:hypothetical protein D3C78_1921740 [compost metagenome]
MGLDLGGDAPEGVALSILAEVSACLNGRSGGMLKDRDAPIHDCETALRPTHSLAEPAARRISSR